MKWNYIFKLRFEMVENSNSSRPEVVLMRYNEPSLHIQAE